MCPHDHLEELIAQLEIERDTARAANRARSRFVAQLSHEIRTPLDAVIGLTDAVLRSALDEPQRERLLEVLLAAETLLGVLNDLLDYVRVEAGDLGFERVPFDVQDDVIETLRGAAEEAEAKGLELACGIDPALPPLLVGDPGRLRYVLATLVRNAIQFTERGEVVVRVVPESSGEDIQLAISVRDTGIGIAPERIARLFETRAADGEDPGGPAPVAPGLPLCRKLVERMGGELRVESAPGAGSTFSFAARIEVTEGVYERHRHTPRPLDGVRALIVDDHAATRELLAELTRAWGMLPALAGSAKDAEEHLAAAESSDEPIRLMLCDAQMPGRGGVELIETIRDDPRFDGMEVVLLHGGAAPVAGVPYERLRIAAQLAKPVHPGELRETALGALGIAIPATPPRYRYRSAQDIVRLDRRPSLAVASAAWVPASRILLVEDSEGSRAVVRSILEGQDHTIEYAVSGRRALERFRPGAFDVVLLDLQMPGMDGFEVSAAIRAREAGTAFRVPIIAMTANALRGDRERCLAAGMTQYLTKPIRRGELFAALLEARQHRVEEAAPEPADAQPGRIDWAAMAELVDGNHRLLREIVEAYLLEIREHLERLPVEFASRDVAGARRRAHSLKGAMGTFSVEDAERAATRLEAATTVGDLDSARALFEGVRRAVGAVLPELERFLAGSLSTHSGSGGSSSA